MIGIIEQLIQFHRSEKWHSSHKTDEELKEYFEIVLRKRRVLMTFEGEKMLGYCESWRINFEQFGRKICHEPIFVDSEDIETGLIAYVANVHILPEHRDGWVYKDLRNQFIKQNFMCQFFVGEATRKKHSPVKVFNRSEMLNKLKKDEDLIHVFK